MWIIPKNHPLFYLTVQESLDLKEVSSELLKYADGKNQLLPLTWKSKCFSLKIFSRAWKRVYWLPHLFGRILKHSTQNHFTEKYTASLAAIPALPLVWPGKEKAPKTLDTFGRIYSNISNQSSLFGASLKTCADTSAWDMMRFTEAFQKLVIQLSQASIRQQKLARHIKGNGYSFLPSNGITWPTPIAQGIDGTTNSDYSPKLSEVAKAQNWATPNTMDMLPARSADGVKKIAQGARKGRTRPNNLREQIDPQTVEIYEELKWPTPNAAAAIQGQNEPDGKRGQTLVGAARGQAWPTPTTAEAGKISNQANYGQIALSNHPAIVGFPMRNKTLKGDSTGGQPHQESHNTNGKNREQLNPAWVAQLMGTTSAKIFFVHLETAW